MLLDTSQLIITNPRSVLGFETEGGTGWKVWDRFLTINGKKAFHIGNICGTCSFFFERLEDANTSINAKDIIEQLNGGLRHLNPSTVQALERIIPTGKYKVLLQTILPKLVQPGESGDYFKEEQVTLWGIDGFRGQPHFPKTEYYRLLTTSLNDGRGLFEFLIPISSHGLLQSRRTSEYQELLNEGIASTAVALSILDIKSPEYYDDDNELMSHWCLAHYLLDGHHKTYAAALNSKPLTLLSFLSLEHGISSQEDIAKLIAALGKT